MSNVNDDDAPTIISSADARGALGRKSVKFGDTLLPTLIGGLTLAVIAVGIVPYVLWPDIAP